MNLLLKNVLFLFLFLGFGFTALAQTSMLHPHAIRTDSLAPDAVESYGDTIFFGGAFNNIERQRNNFVCLNAATGQELPNQLRMGSEFYEYQNQILQGPDGGYYLLTNGLYGPTSLYYFSSNFAAKPHLIWSSTALQGSYAYGSSNDAHRMTTDGKRVFVSGQFSQTYGKLFALDFQTGNLLWSKNFNITIPQNNTIMRLITTDNDRVAVVTENGSMLLMNATNGAVINSSYVAFPNANIQLLGNYFIVQNVDDLQIQNLQTNTTLVSAKIGGDFQKAFFDGQGNIVISGNFNNIDTTDTGQSYLSRLGFAKFNLSNGLLTDWKANIWTVQDSINFLSDGFCPVVAFGDSLYFSRKTQSGVRHYALDIVTGLPISIPQFTSVDGLPLACQIAGINGDRLLVKELNDPDYSPQFVSLMAGVPRKNIGAYKLSTGEILPWAPNANGRVTTMLRSGDTLFISGLFTEINGQPRNHIAAFNVQTGALLAWNPSVGGIVGKFNVSGNTLFVSDRLTFIFGNLEDINGQPRSSLGAIDRQTGAVLPFNPTITGDGNEYTFPCVKQIDSDGQKLFVGGDFDNIDGQTRNGLAAFDVTNHTLTNWNPSVAVLNFIGLSGNPNLKIYPTSLKRVDNAVWVLFYVIDTTNLQFDYLGDFSVSISSIDGSVVGLIPCHSSSTYPTSLGVEGSRELKEFEGRSVYLKISDLTICQNDLHLYNDNIGLTNGNNFLNEMKLTAQAAVTGIEFAKSGLGAFRLTDCTLSATLNPPAGSICPNTPAPVSVTPSGSSTGLYWYEWTGTGAEFSDPNIANPTVTMEVSGSIQCIVHDGWGCADTLSTTINVFPVQNLVISGVSDACLGQSVVLTATGSVGYSWQPGNVNTSTYTLTPPLGATTFTVTGTDANGCTATATHTLTVHQPVVTASSVLGSICPGLSDTLKATGAVAYLWQPGNLTGASVAVSPAATTVYTVTGTDALGCANTATVTVTLAANLALNAQSSLSVICSGQSVNLSATGGGTYNWQPGNLTGANVTVSPTATITYTVLSSLNGCTGTATVSVTVNPTPVTAVNSGGICPGESFTITASGADNYLWNTGETTASIIVTPSITTTYTVSGSSLAGCTSSAVATVTVFSPASVTAAASDSVVCGSGTSTLSATGAQSYVWQPGAMSGASVTVSPAQATTYTVTAATADGCTATATVFVNRLSALNLSLTPVTPSSFCWGDSIRILANVHPAAVVTVSPAPQFQNGHYFAYAPNFTQTYTITATLNGCSQTQTVTATVNRTYTVSGKVIDYQQNKIVSSYVYMFAFNHVNQTVQVLDSALTDSQGQYSMQTDRDSVFLKVVPNKILFPNRMPTYFQMYFVFSHTDANGNITIYAKAVQRGENCLVHNDPINFIVWPGSNNAGPGFVNGYLSQGAGKTVAENDPIIGASLFLMKDDTTVVAYSVSKTDGAVTFENLPIGDYKVWVDKMGVKNELAPTLSITSEKPELNDVQFILEPDRLTIKLTTELDENNVSLFEVFPNPTHHEVNILVNAQANGVITLVDPLGRNLETRSIKSGLEMYSLDLSPYATGLYSIILSTTDNAKLIRKVVKE